MAKKHIESVPKCLKPDYTIDCLVSGTIDILKRELEFVEDSKEDLPNINEEIEEDN